MSLRAFHLLFIALSVVLTAFFAAWAAGQYQTAHEIGYAIVSVASLACGIGLTVYGAAFQRKTKGLMAIAFVLAAPRAALACPVCFGQNDSPMAIAMNMGIIAMLAVVVGVLVAFASFFIHLMRRAKLVALKDSEGTAQ